MKTRRDPLAEALKLKQNANQETARGAIPFAPVSDDMCELFMDELRLRRERLGLWLLILENEIRSDEQASRRRASPGRRRDCGVEQCPRKAAAGREEAGGLDSNFGAA
jgi:hypothetical protein